MIARLQGAQLHALARAHVETTPHFARRLADVGLTADDLAAPDALAALPPLRRGDVQDLGVDLFARNVPDSHLPVSEVRSSGSTGQPVTVRRTGVNGVIWSALTLRDHLWRDLDLEGGFLSCRFRVHQLEDRSTWGMPFALVFRTGPGRVVPLLASVEELARRVVEFGPHLLQVYPSVLGPLADHLAAQALTVPNLRYVHTIGETLSDGVRRTAAERLGVRIWDTYSCEEVGNIAFECPDEGTYHVPAESLIVEVLDEEDRPCGPGERGRVVVTDLHNLASPIVRYDLGDLAEVGEPCGCGRGLPTIRRVLGRQRNLVRLPDGSRHWPIVGIHQFRDIAPIRQFRCTQRTADEIEVEMVVDEPVAAGVEAELTRVIQAGLGHPFRLRFTWLDRLLERPPGGKFEEFRCEL
jgi:phenylacetate-CoA ligase